ncbi:MAG: RecQ family ATP-dependent DNA helicase [Actinomycetes bacterium]
MTTSRPRPGAVRPGPAEAALISPADAAAAMRTVLDAMVSTEAVPHPDQTRAVEALVCERGRVLVVQATGWGKSAVYWAATKALRDAGAGPTLVISPLLALMRDQVAAASRAGLRAVTVNSATSESWQETFAELKSDLIDVLLISPERISAPSFSTALEQLRETVGMIVIDEAHCLSDWGFDFRPDYQRITSTLLVNVSVPVLATTATANSRVTQDVALLLGDQTHVLRGSLARTSLRLSVVPELTTLQRWAWVAQALPDLPGSGIIYCLTVADTTRLADFLTSQGHNVAAYSSALEADERHRIEDRLRSNDVKAVVATSALGMGYDKPDLGFCLHVGSPASPVAYYQQVGRAGRALDSAHAVLLPSPSDKRLWDYFATSTIPDPKAMTRVLSELGAEPTTVPAIEANTGIRRSRVEHLLKLAAVDGAVERRTGGWISTGVPWVYDGAKYDRLLELRRVEAGIMASYAAGAGCLQQFLREALDDPDGLPCGICSVCTGELPPPGAAPNQEFVLAARSFAGNADTVLKPRKMWPAKLVLTGEVRASGRINPPTIEGRSLAFADDPVWGEALTRALAAPDGPLPDPIVAGLVEVLVRWSATWRRPVAVVPVPSRRHPRRVTDLAHRIGEVGRLPVLELLEASGPPPPMDTASKARVEALFAGLSVRPETAVPKGPILLVDDYWRTGWTATVAASLLYRAGTTAVLPLTAHSLP